MLRVKRSTIAFYLAPMFIVACLVTLTPILYTVYLSFTNRDTLYHSALNGYDWVWLDNYRKLIFNLNSDLYIVILLTLLYVAVCIALFLALGLACALALNNQKIRWLPFWRVVLIVPWAVPSIITALIWRFIFQNPFGPLNQIAVLLFGPHASYSYLDHPVSAFIAVVVVNLWLSFSPYTIIILGALQSIPQELYEAAAVDGATAWQSFRRITAPLLRPALTPFTILSAIATFQMFNTVFLVTTGGPYASATSRGATEFVMIYFYNKVLGNTAGNAKLGFMSAFSVLLFFILLAATMLTLRATNLLASPEGGNHEVRWWKRLRSRLATVQPAKEVQA
ncbi:MAG TPA: sugar ABC transporter permease [Ktedonobacterales bacterium]|nr:sugar ABC transporter permease [Ktedonobacterales bacterium]